MPMRVVKWWVVSPRGEFATKSTNGVAASDKEMASIAKSNPSRYLRILRAQPIRSFSSIGSRSPHSKPNHHPNLNFNIRNLFSVIPASSSSRLPTNPLKINHRSMSSDLQARQETLGALNQLGIKLQWDSNYQAAIPQGLSQATDFKIPEQQDQFLKKLVDESTSISFENLMSSLVAGPDNESDEPVDVPIYLGNPSIAHSVENNQVDKLKHWILESLGIPLNQTIIAREELSISPKNQSVNTLQSNSTAWALKRLTESSTFQSKSNQLSTSSTNPSQFEILNSLFNQLQPRWNFEIEIQSKIVCCLIGQVKLSSNSSRLEQDHNTLSDDWMGLISYRIAT
ncbi:hypothetical protein O181_036813 [Austropuccinia psidii MF-1]|uniref:Uncharacterized protein n=1 Tax=Austropuccinia psidii MF-1 TaxID=1389203 RepID=A0A9Q3DA62_9BASI|nr:hypothetical protein [Austropuccinia psidii MF-1]